MTSVKWAGPNTVVITSEMGDKMLVTKRDLLAIQESISAMVKYYTKEFSPPNLDYVDLPWEDSIDWSKP